jgi:hypothetical protein
MNRYNETPQQAMRILNVRAEFDSGSPYAVEIYKGNRKADRVSPASWNGAPLSTKEIDLSYWFKPKKKAESDAPVAIGTIGIDDADDDEGWGEKSFTTDDLVKFNDKTSQFIFEKDGVTLILSKEVPKYFNFDAF